MGWFINNIISYTLYIENVNHSPGLPLLHGEVIGSLSLGQIRLLLLVLLAGQVSLVAAY